jgi:hypothetical protein
MIFRISTTGRKAAPTSWPTAIPADDTIVYPGHDYHGRVSSTIGEEKRFNERLNLSIDKDRFVEMMNNRKTPRPAKMDIALPVNMRAGRMIGEATVITPSHCMASPLNESKKLKACPPFFEGRKTSGKTTCKQEMQPMLSRMVR